MLEKVQDYYGKTLNSSDDLQTNACCDQIPPVWLRPVLSLLHDEVISHYYGCGLVAPQLLEGTRILDLGCGSGRDCYVLSYLTGENGRVIGVDMTPGQLAIARRHQDHQRQAFGFQHSNVEFLEGYIEQLDMLNLPDNSFDIVVSNCVLNLSPDKGKVLREIQRVLKPGGEFYFSDVYADRRIDESLRQDPVLYGECLSGALYWHDFLDLAKQAGFTDPRLVEDRPITINNDQIMERLAPAQFYSATYRLFKLPTLEAVCEDYGQAVIYRGTVPHHPQLFILDKHHHIQRGKVFPICGNTWQMLHDTRFAPHFKFIGDFSTHYGIFQGCGTTLPFDGESHQTGPGCC
ncbi:MAG: methyltransferase domain-containing protein [Gammaproteobacteria bacterium]